MKNFDTLIKDTLHTVSDPVRQSKPRGKMNEDNNYELLALDFNKEGPAIVAQAT
ncbi:Uu.00g031980.m01.CDS01 [Anthostomella pinea]|uniref:Uu.00g031980.m01.CDS01 n=1 Tax=Anthostomella pinea TaxID=933095 RepID=A0AAI8V8L7_9PEZI|nr:Uu.00g031980.m01.CDS01 [Anthostomella pinea]